MAEERFDAYHRWLAIPPHEQPPNHYRLLGLTLFEPSGDVIESAADRQMAHVRTHQTGKHGAASQKLLNEIAAARLLLLDEDRKAAYDAQLRERDAQRKEQEVPLRQAAPLAEKPSASGIGKAPAAKLPNPVAATASKSVLPLPATVVPEPKPAVSVAPVLLIGVIGGGTLLLLLAIAAMAFVFVGGSSASNAPPVIATNTALPSVQPTVDPQPDQQIDPLHVDSAVTDPATQVNPPVPDEPIQEDPPIKSEVDQVAQAEQDETPKAQTNDAADGAPPKKSPIAALFPKAAEDKRKPLPAADARAEKAKQIDELFPLADARTPAEKLQLVQQLMRTGRETENDPAAQYVLFDMARDVASNMGNVEVAFEAIDAIDEQFQVDGPVLKAESLAKASAAPTPINTKGPLIDEGIKVVDELFHKDRYVEAAKLINSLNSLARKTRDKDQLAALAVRQKQGSELFQGFKTAQAAIETLKKNPEDAAAATTAGKYYTFIKGDWQRGLVMLSVGNDEALKKLAETEMAVPSSSNDQKALADAWLKLAGTAKGLEADHQKARAAMWFTQIQASLNGLAKIEVQKKLEAIGKLEVNGGAPFSSEPSETDVASTEPPRTSTPKPSPKNNYRRPIDLMATVNTTRHAVSGDWSFQDFDDDVEVLVVKSAPLARLQIPFTPPKQYVLELEVSREKGATDMMMGLTYQGVPVAVMLDGWKGGHCGLTAASGGKPVPIGVRKAKAFTNGQRSKVVCVVRADSLKVTVDGREVISFSGKPNWDGINPGWSVPKPAMLSLGAENSEYRFYSYKITPFGDDGELPDIASTLDPPVGEEGADEEDAEGSATPGDWKIGKAIDLLPLIDVEQDKVHGEWAKSGNQLTVKADRSCRIQIPVIPPTNYVLEIEATRTDGRDDFLVGLIYQGKQCAAALDGWGGIITGWSHERDWSAVKNHRQAFTNNKRSKITCTVTDNKMLVVQDGAEVLKFEGNADWAGMSPTWTMPEKRVLMLGSQSNFTIHSVKLTPLKALPKLLRSGDDEPVASTPADWKAGKPIDLLPLVDIDEDSVQGEWTKVGNDLKVKSGTLSRLQIPIIPPKSYVLELEATRTDGREDFLVGLAYQGKQCAAVFDGWGGVMTGWLHDRDADYPKKHRKGFTNGNRSKITCTVTETSMRVVQDDQEALTLEGNAKWTAMHPWWAVPDSRTLMLGAQGSYTIHSLKLTPTKELPKLLRPVTSGQEEGESPRVADGKSIDLLKLVDTEKQKVLGDWRMDRGELLTPRISDCARMQIPLKTPAEYDLELDVTRNGGGNELTFGLIYQGKQCSVGIDRYSARSTDIIADEEDGHNPIIAHSGEANILKAEARSKVICKVRKKSITVSVNDREVLSYEGDATWNGMNAGWAVPDKTALMVGAWWADFRIHSFKLTSVKK